ncbi:MAG: RHS repeat-associated core domain-containing protein [Fimbriimonadaceae bacterium]
MGTGNTAHNYSDELIDIKVGGTTVKSFGYDAAGRTTVITYSGATTTLAYDYESRITSISRSGVTTNTFTYNGLDTRVGKVDSGGTKTYKRDGAYVTDPVLSDGAANYTPGISEKRSGTTKYNNADYLGSFTRQTDSSQATSGTRSYDAFGLPTGTTQSPTGPFGFAAGWGYQEDGDYGVKLLGHRYYDGSTGRFLTRDPIRSRANWYSYTANNPTRHVDPSGLLLLELAILADMDARFVPPSPPGVDVDDNIAYIKDLLDTEPLPPAVFMGAPGVTSMLRGTEGTLIASTDWLHKVREGGDWDYKLRGPYADFGNFNYGATGALLYPLELLLLGGDFAAGPRRGFKDPPEDKDMIRRGYLYYHRVYGDR